MISARTGCSTHESRYQQRTARVRTRYLRPGVVVNARLTYCANASDTIMRPEHPECPYAFVDIHLLPVAVQETLL
eukprot:1510765-Alexandrium_andersonii.AAC.1